jgi:hypothetical protein
LGVFLIALFLAIATCILLGVGTALLWPGSKVEVIWKLYPARRAVLTPYRLWLGPAFLMLTIVMVSASIRLLSPPHLGLVARRGGFLYQRTERYCTDFQGPLSRGWYWYFSCRRYSFLPVATPRAEHLPKVEAMGI